MVTVTQIMADHPVREAFAGRSTGAPRGSDRTGYYPTKGHAINAFDAELQTYDFCLDRDDLLDFSGNDSRKIIDVHDEFGNVVGRAVISWYRMPSGRYEFIGYLA